MANAYNRSLIEASLDPLVTIGPHGKITDVNAATEKITGHSSKELIGTDFMDYFSDSEKAKAGYQQVFQDGFVQDYALEIRQKDGHLTSVLYNASVYRDEAGQVMGVFAAARDITERKKMEETLRKSEEKYRTILKNIEEGYYEVDLAGNFTFLNDSMCRIFGYSKDELMGMNDRQYTDKENAKKLFQAYNEVYRKGERRIGYDFEIIRKDGTKRYIEASILLQKDSSDKPIGFRGIIRDITERKRTEEALRQEKDFNQTLVQASPLFFAAIGPDGKTLMMNEAMLRALGYTTDEVVGKDYLSTFVPVADREMLSTIFQRLVNQKEPALNENRVLTRDGRELLVEWHGRQVFKIKPRGR